ncbi:hypothetical protein NCS52_01536300 [Fusarium sp. LHS14.1]|nr:hypothetical protein NCS52_01536300 [Fusarium sp. LHS14.1]
MTRVPNDTELRELLTSPPGAISYVVLRLTLTSTSRLREPSTFRASRPRFDFPRTTDLCSLGCPDDIRSILLLDIQGRCTLTLIRSLTLSRPTSAALSARTTPAAVSCSTFWGLLGPRPRCTGPKWPAALSRSSKAAWPTSAVVYCPEILFSSAALAAARNTTGLRRFVSLDETTTHKPLGRNGAELTWRP